MDHRPTSPHVGIYRWQISNTLSILHRLTGIALYFGTLVLVTWLWSAAYAPDYYEQFFECVSSLPGKVLLIGWTAALYYHLGNGIRHLFWDIGKGYSLSTMAFSGWLVVLFAAGMTAMTWGFIITTQGVSL